MSHWAFSGARDIGCSDFADIVTPNAKNRINKDKTNFFIFNLLELILFCERRTWS
jgi:hypothetical protein